MNLLDSSGNLITTIQTAADGSYSFTNLASGDYIVEFLPPADHTFSPADQGSDDTIDSDADIATGRTDVITLIAGQIDDTVDAGLIEIDPNRVAIGNMVWSDDNGDAIMDGNEDGISGVTVRLYADNGDGDPDPGTDTLVATVNTDAHGVYFFPNVSPGDYFVAIVPPAGFTRSSPGGGSDPVPGDHTEANGDDGTPRSGLIVTQVFLASVGNGPTGEQGNPVNLVDSNAYMTIDFGLTNEPTALTLLSLSAETPHLFQTLVAFVLTLLVAGGAARFIWQAPNQIWKCRRSRFAKLSRIHDSAASKS